MLIAVIHDTYVPDRPCREVLKALEDRGVEKLFLRISKISARIGEKPRFWFGSRSLEDVNGALIRSLGSIINVEQMVRRVTLLEHMASYGTVLMNPLDPLLTSRDKYRTLYKLELKNIPVPKTSISEDLRTAYEFSKRLGRVVVKPIVGSRGFGSVLMDHPEVSFRILKTLASMRHPLYVQEYIPKPLRDIRSFVVNGQVIASMYRYAPQGEWRTNIAQGGRGKPCTLTEECREVVVKVTEAMELWYAGVDLIETPQGPVVIEVNGSPDWVELAEVTKVSPAPFIVDCLINKIRS